MDNRSEVREFLTSHRARVTPDRVGLPAGTANRRVPGLRRSEVATLAGESIEYYTRLERGAISGASPEVPHSLARALCLDVYDVPGQQANIARFTLLDARAHELYPDWEMFADVTVAIRAGPDVDDPRCRTRLGLRGAAPPTRVVGCQPRRAGRRSVDGRRSRNDR